MFFFYFKLYKSNLITFCGSEIKVEFDSNGISAKECFRRYDDGLYSKGKPIITRHPNIVKSVIVGKKGWGLWSDQWSDGIADWSFTKEEILYEFQQKEIIIPESFLKEFEKRIFDKRNKYYKNLK